MLTSADVSINQQGLWFLDQVKPNSPLYTLAWRVRFDGRLDLAALQTAFTTLVARHGALRTRFDTVDGRPVQVVSPEATIEIPVADLGEVPLEVVVRTAEAEAAVAFDLAKEPLLRVRVLRLGPQVHVLVVMAHHIVFDALSFEVLLDELAVAYRAALLGRAPELPPVLQYRDFARWQRAHLMGETLDRLLDYWRTKLAGMPEVLALPMARPRGPEQTFTGSAYYRWLPAELSAGLRDLARTQRCTLFMVVLAAFQVLLHKYSGQNDICVGSAVGGRNRRELERAVGYFVNTLVLRADLSAGGSFADLLTQVRRTTLEALDQQDLPFDRLVQEMRPDRTLAYNPLYQATFELHYASDRDADFPGLRLGTVDLIDVGLSKFDLSLTATVAGTDIELAFEYSDDLFDQATVERLTDHLVVLLGAFVANPGRSFDRVPLTSPAERELVVHAWNRTDAPVADATLPDLFRARVRQCPSAVAVRDGGRSVTYAELDAWSDRFAAALRARGVGPEVLVGVCLDRSVELVVALLGVVKAGGAFVPVSPDLPPMRMTHLTEDARLAIVVTEADLAEVPPAAAPPHGLRPDNPAYVMYTSGSTGSPKGAVNTHRNIVNSIAWVQQLYHLGPNDAMLMKTPIGFDDAVREVFWTLSAGARIVIAGPGAHRDPACLVRLVGAERVTFIHVVPSLLQALVDEPDFGACGGSLRWVSCGGEALPPALQRRYFAAMPAGLANHYGPAEAAVDVARWVCLRDAGDATVPIGRPGANTRLYVLDRFGEPVPPGVIGELVIGGAQVGRGYLGRAALTAERFVPDPFAGVPGARLYRTGDLCVWRADGQLGFAGRADHQVKIRGVRIEPGEIEAALLSHPDVREALVLVREERLVAYLVPGSSAALDVRAVRDHLNQLLPLAMVPGVFVVLPALPVNGNGKVDRRALPAPDASARDGTAAYRAPRTPAEFVLCEIWAEVLERDPVGADDDFFAVGGHSLLAARAVALVREVFGVELQVNVIFQAPTPSAFAGRLAALLGSNELLDEIAGAAREVFELSDDQVRERLTDESRAHESGLCTPDESGRAGLR